MRISYEKAAFFAIFVTLIFSGAAHASYDNVTCAQSSLIGDADGDGNITAQDAYAVLEIYTGVQPSPPNICCIDADGGGYVNAVDGLLIKRYVLGYTNSSGNVGTLCNAIPQNSATITGDFVLSSSPADGGTTSGSAYNITFPSTLNITATPNSGYTFGNWSFSGNCSVENASAPSTIAILLFGNCNATALFSPIPANTTNSTVSTGDFVLSSSPADGGTTSGSAYNITFPSTLNITATPNSGYTFGNWSFAGNCSVDNASSAIAIATIGGSGCNASALFAPIPANNSTAGNITCTMHSIIGDADGDGNITAQDAYMAIEAYTGVRPMPPNTCCIDADGNRYVNAADGLLISRYANGNTASIGNVGKLCLDIYLPLSCGAGSLIGDVDGDGNITAQDAQLASFVFTELVPAPSNICCIDPDASGYINAIDGQMINRHVAGLTTGIGNTGMLCSAIPQNSTAASGDFIISHSPPAGGATSGSAYNITFPSTLNISATPNPGYTFSGWSLSGNCSVGNASAASTVAAINGNCSASALFTANPVTPPPGGNSGGSGGSGNSGGSSNGGGGVNSGSQQNSVTINLDNGAGVICPISMTRDLSSSDTRSVLYTTLENRGAAPDCVLSNFTFTDIVPASFAEIGEIGFSPAYATLDGRTVSFIFPLFSPGESKTLSYSVDRWVPTSRVRAFIDYGVSAQKEQLQAQNESFEPLPVPTPTAAPRANLDGGAALSGTPRNETFLSNLAASLAAPGLLGVNMAGLCLIGLLLLALLIYIFFFARKRKKEGLAAAGNAANDADAAFSAGKGKKNVKASARGKKKKAK